jgi:hypothetical protein
VLKDKNKREVARVSIPVGSEQLQPVTDLLLPVLGQAGRPLEIPGRFDGSFTNSSAEIGGRKARLLAESPRKLIVETPAGVVGPTTISVREGDAQSTAPFRNVGINLSAPRTNLLKGEQTTLTVMVEGLAGLSEPITIQITNSTPGVINLAEGDVQTIAIKPEEVQPGGTYTATRTVSGVKAGSFGISSSVTGPDVVFQPAPGQPGQQAERQHGTPKVEKGRWEKGRQGETVEGVEGNILCKRVDRVVIAGRVVETINVYWSQTRENKLIATKRITRGNTVIEAIFEAESGRGGGETTRSLVETVTEGNAKTITRVRYGARGQPIEVEKVKIEGEQKTVLEKWARGRDVASEKLKWRLKIENGQAANKDGEPRIPAIPVGLDWEKDFPQECK